MPVNSNIQLRFCPASEVDIPTVFSMAKELVDTYEDVAAIDYCKVIRWMERKITDCIHSYTCVYAGDEKAAYFSLSMESGQGELDDLYVLPQFRGQGIGDAIVKHCIAQTDVPLYLYVFKGNAAAIKLYSCNGFRVAEDVSKTRMIMRREVDR